MVLLLASSPRVSKTLPNRRIPVVRRLAVLLLVVLSHSQHGGGGCVVKASPACIHCLNSHSSRGAPYRIQHQHAHAPLLPSSATSIVAEAGGGVTPVPTVSAPFLPPLQFPGITVAFQQLQEQMSKPVAMAMGNRSTQQLFMSFQPGVATTSLQLQQQRHRHFRRVGILQAVNDSSNANEKEEEDGVETVHNENENNETAERTTTTLDKGQQEQQEPTPLVSAAMVATIGIYKNFISPLLPPACRFVPTCSQYGVQAIEQLGPVKGVVLIAWRLLRCSPVGGSGYDPPKWPPVAYTYKGNWMG